MFTESSIIPRQPRQIRLRDQRNQEEREQQEQRYSYEEVLPEIPDLLPYRLNDTGNAQRFTAMFGGNIHYLPEMKSWFVWDKRRWKRDTAGVVQYLAKEAMREFLWQASDTLNKEMLRWAEQSLNVPKLRYLLQAAESEPRIPIAIHELDSHPFLLNCRNGTLNLETGEWQRHRREDLLTKLIDVDYDPGASCPLWTSFINEILPPELVGYMQKTLGYCLSADTSEKAIFIAHGVRDAGKTTLLGTVRELLGEYATLLRIQTLTGHGSDSNAMADLADLCGVRFAQTSVARTCSLPKESLRPWFKAPSAESRRRESTRIHSSSRRRRKFGLTPIHCRSWPTLQTKLCLPGFIPSPFER